MVNALQSLGLSEAVAAGESAVSYRSGEVATVQVDAELERVTYVGPERLTGTVRGGRVSLPGFPRVGFYEASSPGVGPPFDRLPVSLLDANESDVRAADRLEVAGGVVSAAGEDASVRREVWPWFAWGAMALLLVEWWVYTGRMRV
jgi:hypothetical protein